MPMTAEPENRTERIAARLTPRTFRQLKDLAKKWGGIRPLSPADVVTEAIDRAWKAEHQAKGKPP